MRVHVFWIFATCSVSRFSIYWIFFISFLYFSFLFLFLIFQHIFQIFMNYEFCPFAQDYLLQVQGCHLLWNHQILLFWTKCEIIFRDGMNIRSKLNWDTLPCQKCCREYFDSSNNNLITRLSYNWICSSNVWNYLCRWSHRLKNQFYNFFYSYQASTFKPFTWANTCPRNKILCQKVVLKTALSTHGLALLFVQFKQTKDIQTDKQTKRKQNKQSCY